MNFAITRKIPTSNLKVSPRGPSPRSQQSPRSGQAEEFDDISTQSSCDLPSPRAELPKPQRSHKRGSSLGSHRELTNIIENTNALSLTVEKTQKAALLERKEMIEKKRKNDIEAATAMWLGTSSTPHRKPSSKSHEQPKPTSLNIKVEDTSKPMGFLDFCQEDDTSAVNKKANRKSGALFSILSPRDKELSPEMGMRRKRRHTDCGLNAEPPNILTMDIAMAAMQEHPNVQSELTLSFGNPLSGTFTHTLEIPTPLIVELINKYMSNVDSLVDKNLYPPKLARDDKKKPTRTSWATSRLEKRREKEEKERKEKEEKKEKEKNERKERKRKEKKEKEKKEREKERKEKERREKERKEKEKPIDFFTTPLDDVMELQKEKGISLRVPVYVHNMLRALIRVGLSTEGLFRQVASSSKLDLLRESIIQTGLTEETDPTILITDAHVIAGSLNRYIRDMPTPLVPKDIRQEFLDATDQGGEQGITKCKELIEGMPINHRAFFTSVLKMLRMVADNAEQNLMSADNLGIAVGSSLFQAADMLNGISDVTLFTRMPAVAGFLIEHYREIESSLSPAPTISPRLNSFDDAVESRSLASPFSFLNLKAKHHIHKKWISQLWHIPSSNTVLSCDLAGTLIYWDASSAKEVRRHTLQCETLLDLLPLPDGRICVATTQGCSLLDAETHQEVTKLIESDVVVKLALVGTKVSDKNKPSLWCLKDTTTVVYDLESLTEIGQVAIQGKSVRMIHDTGAGQVLLGKRGGGAQVFNAETLEENTKEDWSAVKGMLNACFRATYGRLLLGSGDGNVYVVDRANKTVITTLSAGASVFSVSEIPEKAILASTWDADIIGWDPDSFAPSFKISAFESDVLTCLLVLPVKSMSSSFSSSVVIGTRDADEHNIWVAGRDKAVTVWSARGALSGAMPFL